MGGEKADGKVRVTKAARSRNVAYSVILMIDRLKLDFFYLVMRPQLLTQRPNPKRDNMIWSSLIQRVSTQNVIWSNNDPVSKSIRMQPKPDFEFPMPDLYFMVLAVREYAKLSRWSLIKFTKCVAGILVVVYVDPDILDTLNIFLIPDSIFGFFRNLIKPKWFW